MAVAAAAAVTAARRARASSAPRSAARPSSSADRRAAPWRAPGLGRRTRGRPSAKGKERASGTQATSRMEACGLEGGRVEEGEKRGVWLFCQLRHPPPPHSPPRPPHGDTQPTMHVLGRVCGSVQGTLPFPARLQKTDAPLSFFSPLTWAAQTSARTDSHQAARHGARFRARCAGRQWRPGEGRRGDRPSNACKMWGTTDRRHPVCTQGQHTQSHKMLHYLTGHSASARSGLGTTTRSSTANTTCGGGAGTPPPPIVGRLGRGGWRVGGTKRPHQHRVGHTPPPAASKLACVLFLKHTRSFFFFSRSLVRCGCAPSPPHTRRAHHAHSHTPHTRLHPPTCSFACVERVRFLLVIV